MKRCGSVLALVSLLLLLCSCMGAPSTRHAGEKAITLTLEAEKRLNVRSGEPHPVAVCVYQLRDPESFKGLTGSEDGLYRLLECAAYDSSVADARRIVVNPGAVREVSMDRAAGARFVGIVAGYYTVDRFRVVRFYSLPQETAGLVSSGPEAVPLHVTLRLGSRGILPSRGKEAASGTSATGAGAGGRP
jgi:type VI secretion system VasD/TssJ family lipoprotein